MLRIILAEDHNVVRTGLKVLLESMGDFKIVGEASNGEDVLELLKTTKDIDILLADINMPGMDGLSLLTEVKKHHLRISLIILSMLDSEKYIAQAFTNGADGYLLKNVNTDELVFALKHVSSGEKYLCSELSIKFLERWIDSTNVSQIEKDQVLDLTSREIEVLNLIALGYTNHEISEKLFLSKRTIEGHRQSLIEKTNSRNTAALIRISVLNGIIR